MAMIPASVGATQLEDFDFSPVKEHLTTVKEQRGARPTEEKKREAKEKAEAEARYKTCLWDGKIEKLSNHLTEPPGIFRGRGEHPHAGKLKSRIMPEYVSINIGQMNPIPICPIPGHSWKQVREN